jgi:hypothetical protein
MINLKLKFHANFDINFWLIGSSIRTTLLQPKIFGLFISVFLLSPNYPIPNAGN